MDLPNTPNFNPTWKRTPVNKNRRRLGHFYKKSYFKKLSKILEQPEESKEEENLVKKSFSRGSTLRAINEMSNKSGLLAEAIDGIFMLFKFCRRRVV